jgi:TolA-binding protein
MLQGRNANRKLNTVGRTGISNLTVSLQSSFFAYDEKALARGKRDFERKWGDRPLSDNWRRQEAIDNLPIAALEEEVIEEVAIPLLTDDEVSEIIGTLPTTPEAKISSGLKIQEAMFNLGVLYRNKLNNNEATIRILKELLDRFPKNNYEPEAMYFLYIAYTDLGNSSQAGYYKRSIIAKFPGSKFAEVLTNPNYLAELENEEKRLNNYYNEAYNWFVEGSYNRAYDMVQQSKSKFPPQNKYQAKFALLGAMCQGNLEGEEQYKRALREVVGKYPNTEEQSRAREILRLLGDAIAALPGNAKGDAERFKDEPDQIHYIVISIEDDSDVLNKAKIAVSNYHMQYHKLDKLRISNLYLGSNDGERFPLLVIRKFENKEAAMKYYLAAKRNQKDFIDGKVEYAVFPMSQNNYREILRSKSLDGYNDFFNTYYY